MNKKTLTTILVASVFITLFSLNIEAEIFSTIAMKGLSFASPQAAQVVQTVVCVSNPASCAAGYLTQQVSGGLMSELAKQSPEVAKAVQQYNQVKGWVNEGAKITEDLKLDDKGQFVGGSFKTGGEGMKDYTSMISSEMQKEGGSVKASGGITFSSKGEGQNVKAEFTDGGVLTLYSKEFPVKKTDPPGFVELDRKGELAKTDITLDKDTTIDAGGTKIVLQKDTRLIYDKEKGIFEIHGKDKTVEIGDRKIQINGDNYIKQDVKSGVITGKDFTIDEKRFTGVGNKLAEMKTVDEGYLLGKDTIMTDNRMIITSEEGDVLYSKLCGDVSGFNNYVNPCAKKLTAEGDGFSVRLKEGKQFGLDIEKDDVFEYRLEGGKVVLDNGEQTIIPQKNGKMFVTNGVTTEYKEVDGEIQALISDPNNIGEVDVSMTISYDDSQLETLTDEETGIENTRVCPVEKTSVTTGAVKNIGSITTLAGYECQGVVSLGGKNNILTDKQIKGMKWGEDTVTNVYPVKKYVNPATKEVSYGRIIETVSPDGLAQTFITSDGKGYALSISGLPPECCFDVKGDLNKFGLEYTGTAAPTAEEAGMKWERESSSSSPTKESALDEKARTVLSGGGISGQEYTLGKVEIGSPGIPVLQNGKPIDYVKRVSLPDGRIGYISAQDGDTTYELVNGKLRLAR